MTADQLKICMMGMAHYTAAPIMAAILQANQGRLPDGTPVSGVVGDPGTNKVILYTYEMAKSFYAVLPKAFADHTGVWPDPAGTASAAPGSPVAALQGLLAAPGLPAGVPGLVSQLMALLGVAAPAAVPAPGSELGTAK